MFDTLSTHPRHASTPAEVTEEAIRLLAAGEAPARVAHRFDLTIGGLEQRLRRSGAMSAANLCEVARRWGS